jgi:hypothetical protein
MADNNGPASKFTSAVNNTVDRLRDRRRTTRSRLEELFNRKTFVSVLVAGSIAKVVETGPATTIATLYEWLVPGVTYSGEVDIALNLAWWTVLVFSVWVAVYWERLQRAAEGAADAVEDATSSES